MSDVSFKSFGIFCFSVLCFGLGTLTIGCMASFGDNDSVLPIAWSVGVIAFGLAMVAVYG